MPRKKSTTSKRPAAKMENSINTPSIGQSQPAARAIFTRKNLILLVILILIIVAWKFKGIFIAATVNGQPISKMELDSQLEKRFGSQVLDSLISERLIMGAARQKGIYVTTDEINAKQAEIENRLKGRITLVDALKAQGLSKEDFRRQLEIQISIDKMFTNDSTVSASEIDDYISKNSQTFKSATDPAQVKTQVRDMIHQQKVSDAFDKWFADIKKNANVTKYF